MSLESGKKVRPRLHEGVIVRVNGWGYFRCMTLRGAQPKKPKHRSGRAGKDPFDVHAFLRDLKIVVVDLGGVVILAIRLWHEAAHALAAH